MEQFTPFKTLSKADKIPKFCSYIPLVLNVAFSSHSRIKLVQYIVRTCMKTECVISGTTGVLMDPN